VRDLAADHHRMGLVRQVEIVGVAALAAQQGRIFLSWHRLAELAESVESRLGDLINIYLVAIEAGRVPSNPKFDGRLILDPERSLHYRYGAETECLYLVRPDGYVGYRSEPATAGAFHDYLVRIFSS